MGQFHCCCSPLGTVVHPLLEVYAEDTIKLFDNPFLEWSATQRPALYPPEMLLQSVSDEEKEQIVAKAKACISPKTQGLDQFTQLTVNQLCLANKMSSKDLDMMRTVAEDSFPHRKLDKIKALGYVLPDFHEDTANASQFDSTSEKIVQDVKRGLLKSVLDQAIPLYDDVEATFFDSNAEAALYFDAVLRRWIEVDAANRSVTDGRVCKRKHIDGDVSAMAFSGLGQWWLRAVHGTGLDADWPDRQASKDCAPPAGSVAVIDLCTMADFAVRGSGNFLPYGAAAFFGVDHEVLAVYIPKLDQKASKVSKEGSKMFLAPNLDKMDSFGNVENQDAWQFALWRFKCSLYWLSFGVYHLVHIHWITSNSLVIATREELPPSHRVRQVLWPFLHNSVTINASAAVKLVSKQGAAVRVSSQTFEGMVEMIEWLTADWRYETFEEQLARTKLPENMLNQLPMVQDGRRLWQIISKFMRSYLAIFYLTDDESPSQIDGAAKRTHVFEDPHLPAFWEAADSSAIQARRLGLRHPISFDSLAEYLTHGIFTCTAVHELLGYIFVDIMLPTTTGPRIISPHYFGASVEGRLPQTTVQDYFTMLGIAGAVSTFPMPMIISEMRRLADSWAGSKKEPEQSIAKAYEIFAVELGELSDDLDMVNSTRDTPFGHFNPRVLECSVSL